MKSFASKFKPNKTWYLIVNNFNSRDQINRVFLRACEILRGTADPSDYVYYISAIVLLKYISDFASENISSRGIQFAVPKNASFEFLYSKRHLPDNGERIDHALKVMEGSNAGAFSDFNDRLFHQAPFVHKKFGTERLGDELLQHLLECFSMLDFKIEKNSEEIGDIYEIFIRYIFSIDWKSAPSFITPEEVSDLMARLVSPQPGNSICDPFCGCGSLLTKCGNKIFKEYGVKNYSLFGQEKHFQAWYLANVNLFLHQEFNNKIYLGDTIQDPHLVDENGDLMKFDIVISNPPFHVSNWWNDPNLSDPYNRFWRGIPPRAKGDYAYILHMIETLAPLAGRMCVVVSHGVLFRGSTEKQIRQQLIEENLLDAVIGLPERLFSQTNIPTAILVFKKQKSDQSVLFVDASREFKYGRAQNALSEEGAGKILDATTSRTEISNFSRAVDVDEIRKNDFNLNISRYINVTEAEEAIDPREEFSKYKVLQMQLAELEEEMEGFLEEFGLSKDRE